MTLIANKRQTSLPFLLPSFPLSWALALALAKARVCPDANIGSNTTAASREGKSLLMLLLLLPGASERNKRLQTWDASLRVCVLVCI